MFKSIFTLTLPLLFIIVHALPYPGTQQSTGRYVRLPELQPGQPSTSSTSLVPTVIRDPQLLDLATMSELFKPAVLTFIVDYTIEKLLSSLRAPAQVYLQKSRSQFHSRVVEGLQKISPKPLQVLVYLVYIRRAKNSLDRFDPLDNDPLNRVTKLFWVGFMTAVKNTEKAERPWLKYSGKDQNEIDELEAVFSTTIEQQFEVDEHDLMKFHQPICLWLIRFASSSPELMKKVPTSCGQYVGNQK